MEEDDIMMEEEVLNMKNEEVLNTNMEEAINTNMEEEALNTNIEEEAINTNMEEEAINTNMKNEEVINTNMEEEVLNTNIEEVLDTKMEEVKEVKMKRKSRREQRILHHSRIGGEKKRQTYSAEEITALKNAVNLNPSDWETIDQIMWANFGRAKGTARAKWNSLKKK